MTFGREEWLEGREEGDRAQPAPPDQRLELQRMVQAEPMADRLTDSEEWNYAASVLQAIKETHEKELTELRDTQETSVMTADDLQRSYLSAFWLRTRIDVIDKILELPKDLKEQGQEAAARLTAMGYREDG